jgi:NTP pyrophosphatase (non-canonical NTP hydrolase)
MKCLREAKALADGTYKVIFQGPTGYITGHLHEHVDLPEGWDIVPYWRNHALPENTMEMSEFQYYAGMTSGAYGHDRDRQVLATLAFCGEAGELANKIKKLHAHGHPIKTADIAEELGDCLWYIAEIASAFNIDLEDIAVGNIAKLRTRYPEGFTQEESINRG